MAALFGGSASRSGKKYLVEFKAGKMYLKGKMCHPDKRKGLVYVHQSDDSLMHFCWKDRTSGKVDDDLIIFPDDVEFKRVPQCTTGRVYMLKFKSSTRKFIFWMQEPKTDKDEEHCERVNELLNNPPTPGTLRSGGGSNQTDLLASLAPNESDLQNLLTGMSQQQLLQLINGIGGLGGTAGGLGSAVRSRPLSSQSSAESPTPPRIQSAPEVAQETPAQPPRPMTAAALPSQDRPAVKPAAIQLSDLQSVLSNIAAPGSSSVASEPVNLVEALNSETMIPLLADPSVRARLTPYLPDGIPTTEDELRATVTSPQFQQALSGFSAALASCQLGPVVEQFGLSKEAVDAAKSGDVQAFVIAMQKAEKDEHEKMDEN